MVLCQEKMQIKILNLLKSIIVRFFLLKKVKKHINDIYKNNYQKCAFWAKKLLATIKINSIHVPYLKL